MRSRSFGGVQAIGARINEYHHNNQYTGMSTQTAAEAQRRRSREGRWTPAQADLFEELIQKYGKNWKKIQSFIRGRTLSQIRSHAQKFFRKVGEGRVRQFERKAKLLEALDTLEKEKLRQASVAVRGTEQEQSEGRGCKGAEERRGVMRVGWEQSSEEGEAGELRAFPVGSVKEQFSMAANRESQAPGLQTPSMDIPRSHNPNNFIPTPYLPIHPAFSYYFLPTQPQTFFPGFNFSLNP